MSRKVHRMAMMGALIVRSALLSGAISLIQAAPNSILLKYQNELACNIFATFG
jgi:hypothetical protein